MLLTLKPLPQNGTNGPHEYSIVRQSVPARRSPWTTIGASPAPSASSSKRPRDPDPEMDNHPRRELPPPAAMTRPAEAPMPAVSSQGQLPTLDPAYYSEDSMRQWLRTKAEEDRRRQEEERTRQETLKLEQRRIEQSMLRDAFQAGVPPQMVPLIFVGIGGGNLNVPPDVAQQIDSSIQQAHSWQQQHRTHTVQQQAVPTQINPRLPPPGSDLSQPLPLDVRRDNNRAIPPNPYASQPTPVRTTSPPQPVPASPTQTQLYRGSLQSARLHSFGDSQPHLSMPRLNTSEIQFSHSSQNIGTAQPQPGAAPSYVSVPASAPPPTTTKSETQSTQSPSIYFHHWVPPSQSQPSTPSTRGRQESSSRSHGQGEAHTSPGRKRKAAGSHPPPPPPASQQEQHSPAFSHASPRRGSTARMGHGASHFRRQSDLSHGSRQEHSESDSDNFSRFRPGRDSILNPMQPSSRRTSSDAPPGQPPGR